MGHFANLPGAERAALHARWVATAGALSGPLGSGVGRLPFLRNTYTYPRTFIVDTRVSKRIPVGDR